MGLPWEFLGRQELPDSETPNRGYVYQMLLWRNRVPGGWLLMTLNAKSNTPDPVLSFYPDPEHTWTGRPDPHAATLLRPAKGAPIAGTETLLIPADADDRGAAER